MCDPGKLLTGLLGGGSSPKPAAAVGDPEAERMRAEAEATTSANLRLAASQRRRREQQSLIARGSAPSMGEEASTGDSTLNRTQSLRRNLSPAGSLMSRGAPGAAY